MHVCGILISVQVRKLRVRREIFQDLVPMRQGPHCPRMAVLCGSVSIAVVLQTPCSLRWSWRVCQTGFQDQGSLGRKFGSTKVNGFLYFKCARPFNTLMYTVTQEGTMESEHKFFLCKRVYEDFIEQEGPREQSGKWCLPGGMQGLGLAGTLRPALLLDWMGGWQWWVPCLMPSILSVVQILLLIPSN